jgi:hypothetical protein
VNRKQLGLCAVFHQAVCTTFGYTVALKTLCTTFGYTVALKTLCTTFSHAVFLKTISTTFSYTTFQQPIRTTFRHTTFQQTVRTTLSHTAVHQAIRAAFSEGRLGKGAYSKYRESEAKQELAFHDGVLRDVIGWYGCDGTRWIFLENFIALMVTIDASDGPFSRAIAPTITAFQAVPEGAGRTPALRHSRHGSGESPAHRALGHRRLRASAGR